jgi:fumarate reductase subunit C
MGIWSESVIKFSVSSNTAKASAWLDLVQMLTGAGLVLFMWAHMLLVSSVVISPGLMNAIAAFFEETGLAQVGGPIIGGVFLFHFIVAARKMPFRLQEQKTFWQQSVMLNHADTWLWLVQVVTAIVILIMGSIHIWEVLTNLPITAVRSAARVQNGFWLVFYLILLPLVELHVSIGFYRIGVKWGLIKRQNRSQAMKAKKILFGIFMFIGLTTLLRFYFL